jgi:hypothetical protein
LLLAAALVYRSRAPAPGPREVEPVRLVAELRSWVVVMRARHLYLEILPREGYEHLAGRVEFTAAVLRSDYSPSEDGGGAPRLVRMLGGPLGPPPFGPPADHRLEAVYLLSPEQAACLQRDRVFRCAYALLGANSNAALRCVMEACGLPFPAHIASSGGPLGEFPGVEFDAGEEMDPAEWARHGIAVR